MSEIKLVSIIIPAYNRAHVIYETLHSVLVQTHNNWECLIIDDGSTDDTETVVTKLSNTDERFQYLKRPSYKPKGANACRNYGFEKSKGDYILFLDSDDVLKNTCLEHRLIAFNSKSNLDFVIANTSYYTNTVFGKQPMRTFIANTSAKTFLKHFLSYNLPWTIMSVIWKRNVINEITFDEKLQRFQDVDFHIRVLHTKALQCYKLSEIDSFYRIEARDLKLSKPFVKKTLSAYLFFIKKHFSIFENTGYKDYLKIFNSKMLLEFVIPFYNSNRLISNKILKSLTFSALYSLKQKLYLVVLYFFLATNLYKRKGLGMTKFRKQFKSIITD